MRPQEILSYRDCPIYLNTPIKEIRPTKPGHRWSYHPLTGKTVKAEDYQVYRMAVLSDGTFLLGESATIVHSYLPLILDQFDLPRGDWLYGHMELLSDCVCIHWYNGSTNARTQEQAKLNINKRLPPHWEDIVAGVELTTKYDLTY